MPVCLSSPQREYRTLCTGLVLFQFQVPLCDIRTAFGIFSEDYRKGCYDGNKLLLESVVGLLLMLFLLDSFDCLLLLGILLLLLPGSFFRHDRILVNPHLFSVEAERPAQSLLDLVLTEHGVATAIGDTLPLGW